MPTLIRPTIGILCETDPISGQPTMCNRWANTVRAYGGEPLSIEIKAPYKGLQSFKENIDGLLLPGGNSDVHPEEYGQTIPEDGFKRLFNRERDMLARDLVEFAALEDVALLGICRGGQEINIALGGRLQQKISEIHSTGYEGSDRPEWIKLRNREIHDAKICPGGILDAKIGKKIVRVNSIHRNGMYIEDLARGLRVEAFATEDRMVEAFRVKDMTFGFATQWHAELSEGGHTEAVFSPFIEAARKYASKVGRVQKEHTASDHGFSPEIVH